MISDTLIHNIAAGGAQIALIVAGAALLQWIVRVDAAGVRYYYWRAIAALCLVLPWIQSYRQPDVEAGVVVFRDTVELVTAGIAAAPADQIGGVHWTALAVLGIAVGAVARLGWIAAGFIRLRRLRAGAAPVGVSALVTELQSSLGTRAEVRYAAQLQHPVTFGVCRPVVLLPESLRAQPAEIQRAVLAHELLHVQRRDWAWLVVEEIARAALWFQPAAWWLISRIQLAREEVVDDLTVMVTGRRRTYVEALLAFADPTSLAPTAAFARRRHLFRRIGLVSQEVHMSSARIVVSCAAMAAVIAVGSSYAVSAFPLEQAGQVSSAAPAVDPGPLERRANPITPENPVPRRVSSEPMTYPQEAALVQAAGQIALQVTLDELGRVAEARPVHFGITSPVMELSGVGLSVKDEGLRERLRGTVLRFGAQTAQLLEVYDAIARAATDAVKQWRYDPPFKAPISFPITLRFGPGAPVETAIQVTPDPPVPSNDRTIRVGERGVRVPTKIRDVKPVYPAVARAANVQGIVIMEVRIEPDGSVGSARVLRSIPLLDQAALDAVNQWQFTPTLLNGNPVPVIMTVTINFNLAEQASPEPPRGDSAEETAQVPYWSPDRSRFAFVSERGGGKPQWYVANRDGSALRKLTTDRP
jgi:TonB family protein